MKQKVRIIMMFIICVIFCAGNQTAYAEEQNTSIDCSNYYYERLNELGKTIYKNFEKAKEKFWNNETVEYVIGQYEIWEEVDTEYYKDIAAKARDAYLYDNPEANIWLKESRYTLRFMNNGTIVMSLKPSEKTGRYSDLTSEQIYEAMEKFEATIQWFVSTLQGNDQEKLTQIHNWLLSNTVYDYTYTQSNTRDAYGAIIEGRAVCSGFAQAFKYIADMAGLEVIYVTGMLNGQLHAWNVAYSDGKWSLVDTTIDQGLSRRTNGDSDSYLLSNIDDGIHLPSMSYTNLTSDTGSNTNFPNMSSNTDEDMNFSNTAITKF